MFVIFTVFAGVIAVVNVFTWLQVCKIEMRLRLAIFFYFSVGKRKSVKQCLWPSGQSSASNRPTWRVSFVRACHKLSPAASTFIPPLINVSGACPCVPTVDRLNSCFVCGNWNVTGGSTSSFFCVFFLSFTFKEIVSCFIFFSSASHQCQDIIGSTFSQFSMFLVCCLQMSFWRSTNYDSWTSWEILFVHRYFLRSLLLTLICLVIRIPSCFCIKISSNSRKLIRLPLRKINFGDILSNYRTSRLFILAIRSLTWGYETIEI